MIFLFANRPDASAVPRATAADGPGNRPDASAARRLARGAATRVSFLSLPRTYSLKTCRALGSFACQVISGSTRVLSSSHISMLAVGTPFHVPLGCSRTHAKRRAPVSGAGSSWLVGQKPILMTKNTDMAPRGVGWWEASCRLSASAARVVGVWETSCKNNRSEILYKEKRRIH